MPRDAYLIVQDQRVHMNYVGPEVFVEILSCLRIPGVIQITARNQRKKLLVWIGYLLDKRVLHIVAPDDKL